MTGRKPRWALLVACLALGALAVTVAVGPRHGTTPPAPLVRGQANTTSTSAPPAHAPVLPTSPPAVLQLWMEAIAGGDGSRACSSMTEVARQHLATALAAPDCTSAITQLAAQVENPRTYLTYGYSSTTYLYPRRPQDPVVVDGCTVTWTNLVDGQRPAPGPRPGRFELTSELGRGFTVTGWTRC